MSLKVAGRALVVGRTSSGNASQFPSFLVNQKILINHKTRVSILLGGRTLCICSMLSCSAGVKSSKSVVSKILD